LTKLPANNQQNELQVGNQLCTHFHQRT